MSCDGADLKESEGGEDGEKKQGEVEEARGHCEMRVCGRGEKCGGKRRFCKRQRVEREAGVSL